MSRDSRTTLHPFVVEFTIGSDKYTYSKYGALPIEKRHELRKKAVKNLSEYYVQRQKVRSQEIRLIQEKFNDELKSVSITEQSLRKKLRAACSREIKSCTRRLDAETSLGATLDFPYEVNELMMQWERSVETPKEELVRLLDDHDWYYHYSDDHRYWVAGERSIVRIRALIELLGDPAQVMYNRACPWLSDDGTSLENSAGPPYPHIR